MGLDLAFFMLCPVRRIGPVESKVSTTQHRQSYIMRWPLILTFLHNFTRLLEGKVIRHREKRKYSSASEMVLAFHSSPNIPRHARSFDVF